MRAFLCYAGTPLTHVVLICGLWPMLTGCGLIGARSEMRGGFSSPAVKNVGARRVNVSFQFRHTKKVRGFDTVPKLEASRDKSLDLTEASKDTYFFFEAILPNVGVPSDFSDVLHDALRELSNIQDYETETELEADSEDSTETQNKDDALERIDYTMRISFLRESSYAGHWGFGLTNLVTLGLVPSWLNCQYSIDARVYDARENLVGQYEREANLRLWSQLLLIFAQPFCPVLGAEEEIYTEFLHDVFRQIESERILR